MEFMLAQRRINVICPACPTLAQRCANMLALRWPNEQTYVGPTKFVNVEPTEWPTKIFHWSNVIMLSRNVTNVVTFYYILASSVGRASVL